MSDAAVPQPEYVAFGHYRVLRRPDGSLNELGRGAMGVTYHGFDPELRKPVAIKVIASAYVHDDSTRRRFQREARAAAQLTHPNVAGVLHLGEQAGEFFYAMEFVAGRPLSELLRERRALPVEMTLALLAQVAAALAAAHRRELIHRDLKPANLMLVEGERLEVHDERTAAAGDRQVKVVDFGLARSFGRSRLEDSLATQSSQAAGFTGTPAYASPEQCAGSSELDGRSDLYSLGIILWQCLTGRLPFNGTPVQVLGMHQFQPPPMAQLEGQPMPLIELLAGLLEKNPDDRRPRTAAELREVLDDLRRTLAHAAVQPASTIAPLPTPPAESGASSSLGLGETVRPPTTLRPAEQPAPAPSAPAAEMPTARRGRGMLLAGVGSLVVLLGAGFLWRDRFLPASAAEGGLRAQPGAFPGGGARASVPAGLPSRAPTPSVVAQLAPELRYSDLARRSANEIAEPRVRALALCHLAQAQGRLGMDAAITTFIDAREAATRIPEVGESLMMLLRLATARLECGMNMAAVPDLLALRNLAADQPVDSLREYLLTEVAVRQARLREVPAALASVALLQTQNRRWSALIAVAAEQAKGGDDAGAFRTVQSVNDKYYQGEAAAATALAQLQRKAFEAARRSLELIEYDSQRRPLQAAQQIALAAAREPGGSFAGARRVIENMQAGEKRVAAWRDLGSALATSGDAAGAREAFASARREAGEIQGFLQITPLRDLALAQSKAGERDGAMATLAAARVVAAESAEERYRPAAFGIVAIAYARLGEFRLAAECAGLVGSGPYEISIDYQVLVRRARLGEYAAARAQAEKLPERQGQQAVGYRAIARIHAWLASPAAAADWAAQLPRPADRAFALAGVLEAMGLRFQGVKELAEEDP